MRFLDSLGMTLYSQIIHFIALKPTVKTILSINISIFHASAVLKLLKQKYICCKKMQFANEIGHLFSFLLLVLDKKIFEGNAFWHILALCVSCAQLMKLLCTQYLGAYQSYMCAENKVCRCSNFEEEEV
jgi:hypothetical protein